ncbi:MAG: ABC-F family ATP-binding cassette domain-containing protein [Candidatus Izemoplasma sp.]|nr:ABC-F family ATP-binding cassette domain-containing protein [Candidatus Izemoplasma sp.]
MNILSISKLKKEFNGDTLFSNISFDINTKNKIALIGKNGTGKSTLLKMIIGDELIDDGAIHINKQANIGYLSQSVLHQPNQTLEEEMLDVFKSLINLKERLDECAHALANDPHNDTLLDQYAKLEEQYQFRGGYDYHYKIDYVLTQFGFDKELYNREIKTFSGGEKTRIAFAKLLLENPDLLILDEPTNHLDIEIISWLEDYLNRFDGALLIVTHDKYFIDNVCDQIIEIDHHTSHIYYGNYEQYEEEKLKRYELQLKRYEQQQKEIAHLQSFIDRFRYNAKRASLAKDRAKKLKRIDRIDSPKQSKAKVSMELSGRRATTDIVLEAENLSIGYKDNILLDNISFAMRGFEKLGIVGPNGTGKTTLINVIRNRLKPLSGRIKFLRRYRIGYFDQNQSTLHHSKTIFEEIHDLHPLFTNYDVRTYAARFLFFNDDLDKPISVLSGGEKVRLQLLLLMLEKPDLLILDEPTNHLDIDTKDIIEDVIEQFEGPVLFVSHDRYFINRIATRILYLAGDNYYVHDGDFNSFYNQYREQSKKQKNTTKTSKKTNKQDKEALLKDYEQQIHSLEKKLNMLQEASFDEENYLDAEKGLKIQAKMTNIQKEIRQLEQSYFDILEQTEEEV